jgi:carboxyl-terminal processing protease
MRIRTSVQVALIVGACTVLAPLYGPSIRARAATTPQDDLDKSFKALATVYSLVEQNYADPVSSEKAIYQGAIPGMLRTLDPHSNFLDPTEYQDMQRKQRAVLRHRDADFDGRHQGDRHGAVPGSPA